jgi:hypothetical protein
MEEEVMSGACSTYGRKGEINVGFWRENLNETDEVEDVGVEGTNMIR